ARQVSAAAAPPRPAWGAARAGARVHSGLLPGRAGRLRPPVARALHPRASRDHVSRRVVRGPLSAAEQAVSHGRPRAHGVMRSRDYRTAHVGAESWAKDYDATLFAPGSFNAVVWEREQRLLDEVVQRHVARRDSYLDFACGTGRV